VVAFATGGIPEVVDPGITGVLTHTPAEMARSTIELLCDEARRSAMSRAAREAWQQRFTLDKFQDRLLAMIEDLA
jgi:glycosyltransferase involved in cell wall biosynthesis